MQKNEIDIDQIKEEINKLKLEIIEREDKIAELIQIIYGNDEENNE